MTTSHFYFFQKVLSFIGASVPGTVGPHGRINLLLLLCYQHQQKKPAGVSPWASHGLFKRSGLESQLLGGNLEFSAAIASSTGYAEPFTTAKVA